MGKYEDAKYLVRRKAKKNHTCKICEKQIISKDEYYSETLGSINVPRIVFYSYCLECGEKSGLPIK